MSYHLNVHSHVKIWLSHNPDVFMNFENQTRMIEMREKNPKDKIHLVYDSSLLNRHAINELHEFCRQNDFISIDADQFKERLQSEEEHALYDFYKDEITHLKEGGNLGVASDILRWLSACYRLGIYTDLDVPLDTRNWPEIISVESPLLLNIGSLKLIGKKEMLLTLNEYIAVADEEAAKEQIKQVHKGLISKLTAYSSDYIKQTEELLDQGNFLNRTLLSYMKNRSESLYIKKSSELKIGKANHSSRKIRAYINEIMSDKEHYLNFHKLYANETHKSVIRRLRNHLKSQLSPIKWFFFEKEYNEIKRLLAQKNEQFIASMMKKERSLYFKSIVICTTGPVEVARSLYGKYIFDSEEINERIRPTALSHYDLHQAFQSRNVIPLHENAWNMLRYLGANVGELNDSSWLEEGISLQELRYKKLIKKRENLAANLPSLLLETKQNIKNHIQQLEKQNSGFFIFWGKNRKKEKIKALTEVLACFECDTQTFNIDQFRSIMTDIQLNKNKIFAGLFFHRTQRLIEHLDLLCYTSLVYRLAQDKKINLVPKIKTNTNVFLLQEKPKKNTQHSQFNNLKNDNGSQRKPESKKLVNPAHCNTCLFTFETKNKEQAHGNSVDLEPST